MAFISYFTPKHSIRTSRCEQKIMCWRQLSHTKGTFIKPSCIVGFSYARWLYVLKLQKDKVIWICGHKPSTHK